jgi:hypothetical protein
VSRPGGAVLVAAALACGMPGPAPRVRVLEAEPEGDAVATDASFVVRFSGAVAPDGIADGRRIVLARAEDLRAALAAVESDDGAAPGPAIVAARAALGGGGARAELTPEIPLAAGAAHVLVVSSRLVAADGRPVLDPAGRRAPFVHAFSTAAPVGPPAVPVIMEVKVDAATPEAGGEYVEVVNLGDGAMDLRGHHLAKRTAAGALASCAIALAAGGPVGRGGYAIVAGGAWDGRHALPPGTARYACGTSGLLGGIANDRPPEILLLAPSGAVIGTIGAGGQAPVCADLERVLPSGPDWSGNLACAAGEGTPGACNESTPPEACP